MRDLSREGGAQCSAHWKAQRKQRDKAFVSASMELYNLHYALKPMICTGHTRQATEIYELRTSHL